METIVLRHGALSFTALPCGPAKGPIVLLLHGFPDTPHTFTGQLSVLAGAGYRAIAPTMRGYEPSSQPADNDYRVGTMARDVLAWIDHLGTDRVHLIGHDWGAAVAYVAGALAPDRFLSLTTMAVPHAPRMMSAVWSVPTQFLNTWYMSFFQLPWLPEYLLGKDRAEPIAEMFRKTSANAGQFPTDVREVYRRNAAQPGALTAMVNFYRAMLRGDRSRPRIDPRTPIEVPTLMVWGEDDVALDKSTTLTTGDYVNDFTIRYLPGVSHWVQQEQPEGVNEMIRAFIQGEEVPEYRPV